MDSNSDTEDVCQGVQLAEWEWKEDHFKNVEECKAPKEPDPEALLKCANCDTTHCGDCIDTMHDQWLTDNTRQGAVRCGGCDQFECTRCLTENTPDEYFMQECHVHVASYPTTKHFCESCRTQCQACLEYICEECVWQSNCNCGLDFCSPYCIQIHMQEDQDCDQFTSDKL